MVSIEYRFIPEATADKVVPPVKGPLTDAARALQFVRSKAKEWNIDKTRIGATGGSAGACSSLWLAFHDDMADPEEQRSDRPRIDPPDLRRRERRANLARPPADEGMDAEQQLRRTCLRLHGRSRKPASRSSRSSWKGGKRSCRGSRNTRLTNWSPRTIRRSSSAMVRRLPWARSRRTPRTRANFGVKLQEKCRSEGVECHLAYPGATDLNYHSVGEFLIAKLKDKETEKK